MADFHTTSDVAEIFGCSPKHVRTLAARCRVGFNVGGRSGWKFSAADIDAMRESMRPALLPVKQRPRSHGAGRTA